MVRQLDPWVQRDDGRIIPLPDLSGVDTGEGGAVELHSGAGQAGQVAIDRLRRNCQRHIDDLAVPFRVSSDM